MMMIASSQILLLRRQWYRMPAIVEERPYESIVPKHTIAVWITTSCLGRAWKNTLEARPAKVGCVTRPQWITNNIQFLVELRIKTPIVRKKIGDRIALQTSLPTSVTQRSPEKGWTVKRYGFRSPLAMI
jgi:hypothetical protein